MNFGEGLLLTKLTWTIIGLINAENEELPQNDQGRKTYQLPQRSSNRVIQPGMFQVSCFIFMKASKQSQQYSSKMAR